VTQKEKQISIGVLSAQLNSSLSEYDEMLNKNAGYLVRKGMKIKIRELQAELKRVTALTII